MKILDNIAGIQELIKDNVRSSVINISRSLPAFPVLTAVLSVVFPAVVFPSCRRLPALLPVLLTLAGWKLLGTRRALFQIALPALLGTGALFLHARFRQNDALTRLIGDRPAGIEARIVVCDPSCYPDGNGSSYRRVLCRAMEIRFSPSDPWQRTGSTVIGIFPPEIQIAGYGSCFTAQGTLEPPDPPLLEGEFDYRNYLQRKGIHYLFRIRKAVPDGERFSVLQLLLRIRDRLLRSLTSAQKRPEERALSAALLFGCRQGISRETRTAFIESGSIHILTVSGLHIGMFAAAVFLLLLPLPFRLRMVLTPLITLLYAFSTGMQMPALRAVLMLFCWCIPRAFLLRSSGLNSVLLAGALLLLWNPYQLKDAGFQYSFLCVLTLIMTSARISEWLSLTAEKRHWIPEKKQGAWKGKIVRGAIAAASAAAGCLTAWLCSFILTVYYQGLTIPFAMAANLLIIPITYLIFLLFSCALLPCLLFPAAGKIFSVLLSLPVSAIDIICRNVADWSGGRVAQPPLWTVPCAVAALWLLLFFPCRKAAFAGLGAFLALILIWCCGLFTGDPGTEMLLLYGGRQRLPGLVISCPERDFSLAANLSDFRSVSAAADYLHQRGHPELTLLIGSKATREFLYGLRYFPERMKTRHLLTVQPKRRSETLEETVRELEKNGMRLQFQSGPELKWSSGGQKIETILKNGEFSFDISEKENKVHIRMSADGNGWTELLIRKNGGPPDCLRLPGERTARSIRRKLDR